MNVSQVVNSVKSAPKLFFTQNGAGDPEIVNYIRVYRFIEEFNDRMATLEKMVRTSHKEMTKRIEDNESQIKRMNFAKKPKSPILTCSYLPNQTLQRF